MKGNAARRRAADSRRSERRSERGEPENGRNVVPFRGNSVVPWALDVLESGAGTLADLEPGPPAREPEIRRKTKKGRILDLYRGGTTEVARIAEAVGARPSYVAQVLQREGLIQGYFDLYTSTNQDQNVYSHYFHGVLSFRNVEAAEKSVARINELYQEFHRAGDRAGQHQAMVVALTGMNRARWCGKTAEAQVFRKWLMSH